MKKTMMIAGALSLGLVLGGCSDEGNGDSEETAGTTQEQTGGTEGTAGTDGAEEGTPEQVACAAFFDEGANTLADRAEAARQAIQNGEIVDMASYGEVNLLEQRIRGLAAESPEEISNQLETVNGPFQEAVTAVNADAQDPETGEITLPEIDVTESETAQSDLEATCEG